MGESILATKDEKDCFLVNETGTNEYFSTINTTDASNSKFELETIFDTQCVSNIVSNFSYTKNSNDSSSFVVFENDFDYSVCVSYFLDQNGSKIINNNWNSTQCAYLRDECMLFNELCVETTVSFSC